MIASTVYETEISFGEWNFSFFKNSQVHISFKLNEKNLLTIRAEKVPEDVSWSHFSHSRKLFRVSVQKFCHCFTWYHWPIKCLIVFFQLIIQNIVSSYVIIPDSVLCCCITMCNLHRCYTSCTGVTLELVLHLNCTAVSQSESSDFFSCVLLNLKLIKCILCIYSVNLRLR